MMAGKLKGKWYLSVFVSALLLWLAWEQFSDGNYFRAVSSFLGAICLAILAWVWARNESDHERPISTAGGPTMPPPPACLGLRDHLNRCLDRRPRGRARSAEVASATPAGPGHPLAGCARWCLDRRPRGRLGSDSSAARGSQPCHPSRAMSLS